MELDEIIKRINEAPPDEQEGLANQLFDDYNQPDKELVMPDVYSMIAANQFQHKSKAGS